MGQGSGGVGGGVGGGSEKAFIDSVAPTLTQVNLGRVCQVNLGGRVQDGRPWQKKQIRGARTWAGANLSTWALEETNRKDVLP